MTESIGESITQYRRQGFNRDQLKELEEGLDKQLDVTQYASPDYYAIQMHQIRLGLLAGVDVSFYRDPEYDWFQMEEIRLGLEEGLDVTCYAKREIPFETMREIRKGLTEGIHLEKYAAMNAGYLREMRHAFRDKINIIPYIKEGYIPEQLIQIRYALKKHLDIDPYLNLWFRGEAIHQIALGIEEGLNVSLYADTSYDWHQMEEIRLGLEHRIDASRYARKLASWRQMHEIRLGLEAGLDVSSYESLMYPGREMYKRRLALEKKAQENTEEGHIRQADQNLQPSQYDEVDPGKFKVRIGKDGLKAYINVGTQGKRISPDVLVQFLKSNRVVTGYLWDVIAALGTGRVTGEAEIARGREPKDGKDGYYQYFLEGKSTYQPVYNEDGSIDFGRSIWYQTVETGERLVLYHKAGKAIPGMTVMGESLDGQDGAELPALSGRGFKLLEDGVTYVAEREGVITYEEENYSLKVVPLLVIDDMNALSNTIIFDGTVHVRGQMESGTRIEAGGDVYVDDFVAGATIEAKGNIILKKGIRGNVGGILKAGQDIDGNFFEQARMDAGDSIRANYCLNCDMVAGNAIMVLGKQGYIGGGNASAGNLIRSANVGNRMNLTTNLYVGIRDELYEKFRRLEEQKKENENQLKILESAIEEFYLKFSPEQRNSNAMFLMVEDAIYTKKEQQKALMVEQELLKEQMEKMKRARIVVEGTVYEGTRININNALYQAPTMGKVVFRYTKDGVAFSKLNSQE